MFTFLRLLSTVRFIVEQASRVTLLSLSPRVGPHSSAEQFKQYHVTSAPSTGAAAVWRYYDCYPTPTQCIGFVMHFERAVTTLDTSL